MTLYPDKNTTLQMAHGQFGFSCGPKANKRISYVAGKFNNNRRKISLTSVFIQILRSLELKNSTKVIKGCLF